MDADCSAREYSACSQCDRPNCAGSAIHPSHDTYLGCRQCGIELNDVQALFDNPSLRSPSTCELCGYRYRHDRYASLHFLSHFNVRTLATEPLYCMQCSEQSTDEANPADHNVQYLDPESDDDDAHAYDDDRSTLPDAIDENEELIEIEIVEVLPGEIDYESSPSAEEECHASTEPNSHDHELGRSETDPDGTVKSPARQRSANADTLRSTDFECKLCDDHRSVFSSRAEYLRHTDTTHRDGSTRQFHCAHCDRRFPVASHLALHMLRHTKDKRYACNQCDRSFGRATHLLYHKRSTHTEQKLFACERCPDATKRFKTVESLRRHIRHMHPAGPAEAVRYACEQCDRVFKDSSDRRRHRYTHGGFERRFACEQCDKRFYDNRSLRAHQRVHARKSKHNA